MQGRRCLAIVILLLVFSGQAYCSFTFTVGDYYATDPSGSYGANRIISQYGSDGQLKGSLALPNTYGGVHGIAFGPDGLLYATVEQGSNFCVLAITSAGAIDKTYAHTGYVAGSLCNGSITFDKAGHFYVGNGLQLIRFTTGDTGSGDSIWYDGTGVYSTTLLPNGNLLIAGGYSLCEATTSGQKVNDIVLSDPGNIAQQSLPVRFVDVRGVEYDPSTGNIFVTALGYSGVTDFTSKLLKINGSGELLGLTTFLSPADIWRTMDGQLVVGSTQQSPYIFTTDLGAAGILVGGRRAFVTQYVPEPSSSYAILCGIGCVLSNTWRRRRMVLLAIRRKTA